jgi:hypothetical protein
MKLSTLIRWVGPAAIGGGVFMVFSELSGLPIHIPYLSQDTPTGYAAIGSGLILFALVLLLVGMVGLYAGRPSSRAGRVIEYGDARGRYVLIEEEDLAVETVEVRAGGRIGRGGPPGRCAAPGRHRGSSGSLGRLAMGDSGRSKAGDCRSREDRNTR